MELLKATVLLSVVGFSQACNPWLVHETYTALTTSCDPTMVNNILQMLAPYLPPSNGTTVATPLPTTEIPTTEMPTTTEPPTTGCQCGKANREVRIVNGVATEKNEYPWQVGITHIEGSRPWCGGTIIDSKTILTAAHCVKGETRLYAIVGDHDISKSDGERYIRAKRKFIHPDYNSATTDYDFAVLRLEEELVWTKDVQPACLPTQPELSYDNKESIISGWGTLQSGGDRPTLLQEATVTTMTNAECCAPGKIYPCSEITESMICAAAPGTDSCQGDSGGPMVTMEGSSYVVTGIVSWGYGCAVANAPGVYARVTNQLDWIKGKMRGTTCPPA